MSPSRAALHIGNDDTRSGEGAYDGLIDELRVYNRPLSTAEIAALGRREASRH